MPKPKGKAELLAANNEAFTGLNDLLDSLPPKQLRQKFVFEHRDKNVRDVLAHVYEWQVMLLGWYKVGNSGGQPIMPAKDYSWRETPKLNAEIWLKHQKYSLPQIRGKLARSHANIRQVIESHTENELFEKRYYPWTGSTSLASYLTSATWSHYAWALKLLRKFVRSVEQ